MKDEDDARAAAAQWVRDVISAINREIRAGGHGSMRPILASVGLPHNWMAKRLESGNISMVDLYLVTFAMGIDPGSLLRRVPEIEGLNSQAEATRGRLSEESRAMLDKMISTKPRE
jgi:hypothetical protein